MQSLHLPTGSLRISVPRIVSHKHRCLLRQNKICGLNCVDRASQEAGPDQLRIRLAEQFPNTLLLEGQQLPGIYSSKHFVNLTNGLELAPLLQQLQLPFSVVRIRSTNLEQQSFEALMLELDANLLFSLALGHSCVIWDCGSRNRNNGAPRAVWYGLEFVRYALNRFWLGQTAPAHLRGYNVADTFEAACRKFHPTTKKRLRYYKRFLSVDVQRNGVLLYGVFKRTERDEDVDFFVDKAVQHCGVGQVAKTVEECYDRACNQPAVNASSDIGMASATVGQHAVTGGSLQQQPCWAEQLSEADLQAYEVLVSHGLGIFASGLSHPQYLAVQQTQQAAQQQYQQQLLSAVQKRPDG